MTSVAREIPRPGTHWESRPVLADLLRGALLAVPLVSSVSVVYVLGALIPMEQERSWWALTVVLTAAVVTAVVTERVVQRLLPLTVLLQLTMLFPDRAPSRLRLARAAVAGPPTELFWSGAGATPTTTSETVLALISALGAHDRRTRGHSERVRVLCDVLAQELKLDRAARDRLRWAALLHDVGKMAVSPDVLNKPAALNHDEFDAVREHPVMGASISAPLLPWLGEWGRGILEHHERFDGSGYPAGISGHQISDAGRIIAIVDSFETMTAARAYKKPMATRAAREELARCAGTQFDPVYVRAFLAVSLPRMMWALGPLSFLVHAPFMRSLAEAGARSGAATGQAAASAAGVAVLATAGIGSLESATADDPFASAAPSASIPFVQAWPGAEAPLTTAVGSQSSPIDLGVLAGSRSREVPGGGRASALRTPGTPGTPGTTGSRTGATGSTGGPAARDAQADQAPGSASTPAKAKRPAEPGRATEGDTGKPKPDGGRPTVPGRDARPDSSTARPPVGPAPEQVPAKPPTKRPALPELPVPVSVPDVPLTPADRRVLITGPDTLPAGGPAVFVLSTPAPRSLSLQCRDTTDGRGLGGAEAGWRSCGPTVTFNRLAPGRYTLQARSVDDGRTGAVSTHSWRMLADPVTSGSANGSPKGAVRPPQPGRPGQPGHAADAPAAPAKPGPPADRGRPDDPGQPGAPGQPTNPGRPDGAGRPEDIVQGRSDVLEDLPVLVGLGEPPES